MFNNCSSLSRFLVLLDEIYCVVFKNLLIFLVFLALLECISGNRIVMGLFGIFFNIFSYNIWAFFLFSTRDNILFALDGIDGGDDGGTGAVLLTNDEEGGAGAVLLTNDGDNSIGGAGLLKNDGDDSIGGAGLLTTCDGKCLGGCGATRLPPPIYTFPSLSIFAFQFNIFTRFYHHKWITINLVLENIKNKILSNNTITIREI